MLRPDMAVLVTGAREEDEEEEEAREERLLAETGVL